MHVACIVNTCVYQASAAVAGSRKTSANVDFLAYLLHSTNNTTTTTPTYSKSKSMISQWAPQKAN